MTTKSRSLALIRASLSFALVSCAGSASTTRPAAPPGASTAQPPSAAADTFAAAPAPAAAMAAPPAPSERVEILATSPHASSNELDRAERTIASGDCATACRALGSMERAVSLLCAQSRGDGDAGSCVSAKARLAASRKHVLASCGACPSGPNLLPDAPVPSSP